MFLKGGGIIFKLWHILKGFSVPQKPRYLLEPLGVNDTLEGGVSIAFFLFYVFITLHIRLTGMAVAWRSTVALRLGSA